MGKVKIGLPNFKAPACRTGKVKSSFFKDFGYKMGDTYQDPVERRRWLDKFQKSKLRGVKKVKHDNVFRPSISLKRTVKSAFGHMQDYNIV